MLSLDQPVEVLHLRSRGGGTEWKRSGGWCRRDRPNRVLKWVSHPLGHPTQYQLRLPHDAAEPDEASAALETLSLGFSDFTNDFRGDVGSWIRIATAKAWSPILAVRQLTSDETDRVVACMARLALERLDSVRKVAGGELVRIATLDGPNERHLLELKPLRDLARYGGPP